MSYTEEPEMLLRFMQGLKDAAGSAHQLAHSRKDPRWLQVRDALEVIRAQAGQIAVRSALTRTETLQALDRRKMRQA